PHAAKGFRRLDREDLVRRIGDGPRRDPEAEKRAQARGERLARAVRERRPPVDPLAGLGARAAPPARLLDVAAPAPAPERAQHFAVAEGLVSVGLVAEGLVSVGLVAVSVVTGDLVLGHGGSPCSGLRGSWVFPRGAHARSGSRLLQSWKGDQRARNAPATPPAAPTISPRNKPMTKASRAVSTRSAGRRRRGRRRHRRDRRRDRRPSTRRGPCCYRRGPPACRRSPGRGRSRRRPTRARRGPRPSGTCFSRTSPRRSRRRRG